MEQTPLTQLIIGKGSDVNKVDAKGKTPLTTVCSGGNEKITKILIDIRKPLKTKHVITLRWTQVYRNTKQFMYT